MDKEAWEYSYKTILSPVGQVTIVASEEALKAVIIDDRDGEWRKRLPGSMMAAAVAGESKLLTTAGEQLEEYFKGQRSSFDIPLDPEGTAFQKKVWKALLTIGYGDTVSYGDVARMSGNKRSTRAVGQANNRNPISIIIPCHRVIGHDGALTGYASGLKNKDILLRLESEVISRKQ